MLGTRIDKFPSVVARILLALSIGGFPLAVDLGRAAIRSAAGFFAERHAGLTSDIKEVKMEGEENDQGIKLSSHE